MYHFLNILLTLGAGGIFGLIFMRFKIPNGLRIGALFGVALLGIFFRAAWMPTETKFIVQVIAGALVGCTMEKSDLKRMPMIIKPTLIVLGTFLILTLSMGSLIHVVGPLDWATALLCVVPGGITDMPIIAADMGADTPKVAVVQLARYIMGVAFFPSMIVTYDTLRLKAEAKAAKTGYEEHPVSKAMKREKSKVNSVKALVCTLAVGSGAGFLGSLSGIPAGTFLFSVIGVLVLKLKFDFAYISPGVKNIILLISGCYIGSLITMEDVRGFRLLALPLLLVLGGYIVNCFITGKIISKTCGLTRKEGLLSTTPAGASDIALASADIGVENTDIIIIQVIRAIVAAAIFPQIINALLLVLPE
jgi:membrane AbrB-like protein